MKPNTIVCGVLLMLCAHVANRKNVWYAANGWMYCCCYVAERARVVQPSR